MDFNPYGGLTPEIQMRLADLTRRVMGMLHIHHAPGGLFEVTLMLDTTELCVSALSLEEAVDKLEYQTEGVFVPPLPPSIVGSVFIGATCLSEGMMFAPRHGETNQFAIMELVCVPGWTWRVYAKAHRN